eukprot:4329359-Prymnesium_polylepis.1
MVNSSAHIEAPRGAVFSDKRASLMSSTTPPSTCSAPPLAIAEFLRKVERKKREEPPVARSAAPMCARFSRNVHSSASRKPPVIAIAPPPRLLNVPRETRTEPPLTVRARLGAAPSCSRRTPTMGPPPNWQSSIVSSPPSTTRARPSASVRL